MTPTAARSWQKVVSVINDSTSQNATVNVLSLWGRALAQTLRYRALALIARAGVYPDLRRLPL
ncbi:hypothetical protein ACNKHR_05490 [Shigella flexneri]